MCHVGETEIGGFGITSVDDLLLVEDFVTVKQHATPCSVEFIDDAVADYFDDQIDAGRQPRRFARLWLHTHPGNSPHPSSVDERTFARVFGNCDWSVMAILARGGQSYARLQFTAGPGGSILLPVTIVYSTEFAGTDRRAWLAEYQRNVIKPPALGDRGGEIDLPDFHEVDQDGLSAAEEIFSIFDRDRGVLA